MKKVYSVFKPLRHLKYLLKKPITKDFKDIFDNPREVADNYRGFHVNDWEECIGCSTCGEICPTEAITMVERSELEDKDGSLQLRPTIDYGRCCFCALCVDVCTTSSLKMSKEYLYNDPDPDSFYFMPTDTFNGKEVKLGYEKDESSDLLDLERVSMEHLSPDERKGSFLEIIKGYSKEQAIHEASRCVECGICTNACPAHMNIPEYITAIWENNFEEALTEIYKTNPLPAVCGRICTHNCETACALTQRGDAVAIRWLKRYIVDNAPKDIYDSVILEQVSKEVNGKVAIIGAGPSGLAAAYYLRTIGYNVEIFEQMPLAGGVMRYGIPKYRLPDEAIDQDISFIEKIGVKINLNTKVTDTMLADFNKNYDAVFTGSGFFAGRKIPMPGHDHKDCIAAMDFLPLGRDYGRGTVKELDVHENVVIIGGGNVAFDVARTVVRYQNEKFGKSNVMMAALESEDALPADLEEVVEGREEGVKYHFGMGPQEIVIKNNKIKGLKVKKVISIFDTEGNFNPSFEENSEQLLEATQVFMAIGQSPDYSYLSDENQNKMNINRGKIEVKENGQVKGIDWLFAGGDIVKGPDVISGVANGHNAAIGIDEYLSKKNK
ncbi:FAD-dependent oxidoreductase [Mycoplasmatota bacterium]|nr:FAD-dependent oxidoreductase [Mycoplasmatota bacterium]